jgi:hypothetical protein
MHNAVYTFLHITTIVSGSHAFFLQKACDYILHHAPYTLPTISLALTHPQPHTSLSDFPTLPTLSDSLTHKPKHAKCLLLRCLIERECSHVSPVRCTHGANLVIKPWHSHTVAALQTQHVQKATHGHAEPPTTQRNPDKTHTKKTCLYVDVYVYVYVYVTAL